MGESFLGWSVDRGEEADPEPDVRVMTAGPGG